MIHYKLVAANSKIIGLYIIYQDFVTLIMNYYRLKYVKEKTSPKTGGTQQKEIESEFEKIQNKYLEFEAAKETIKGAGKDSLKKLFDNQCLYLLEVSMNVMMAMIKEPKPKEDERPSSPDMGLKFAICANPALWAALYPIEGPK